MINHIVMWNFKDSLNENEKKAAAQKLKENLEAIVQLADGIISLEVVINEMDSSNKDIALISKFQSVEALNAYQVHPAHVQAGEFIKKVTCDRVCMDFRQTDKGV